MKFRSITPVAMAVTLALGAPAIAQDAPPGARTLDEVVVTAQRRQETVQDIPIAVSAFDAGQLQRVGVQNTLDISRLIPNMTGGNNTGLGSANVYTIRGLNNTESIATFDPPVGSYVDDVYISRQNANNLTLFDVERIEVLRGPQGTLFGRNTTGGAVNVIMRRPGEEFGGYVEVGYGRFNRKIARGSVDLPVNDQVLTKFSAFWIEDDGYVDNLTTGQTINSDDNKGARIDVRLFPNDSIVWDLSADYIDQDFANQVNTPDGSRRIANSGLRTDRSLADLGLTIAGDKQFITSGNVTRSWSLTSNFTWDSPIGEIQSITGYRDLNQRFLLDFLDIGVPPGGFSIVNNSTHQQFTQEIKLAATAMNDALDYVVGVFYIDEDNRTDFADLIFGTVFADRILDNTTEAWAIYGQADYAITDRLTGTLGLRYTDEKKDVDFIPNPNPTAVFRFASSDIAALGIPLSQSTKIWTPRFALRYDINDDMNVYASATRGFKSGGWNARGNTAVETQPFGPEKVWSYEVGMRSELLDRRLRLNATAFWTDVTDYQLPSAFNFPTDAGDRIVFITGNFAGMEIKGIELEALALATERLTVFANIGIMDGKYTKLSPEVQAQQADCIATGNPDSCNRGIIRGDGSLARPQRQPDYTAVIGFDYAWPIGPNLELIPSAAFTRYGSHTVGTNDDAVSNVSGGYSNLIAAVTLEETSGLWSLRLECKNCQNRDQLVSTLAGQQYYNLPRTWQASFRYNF